MTPDSKISNLEKRINLLEARQSLSVMMSLAIFVLLIVTLVLELFEGSAIPPINDEITDAKQCGEYLENQECHSASSALIEQGGNGLPAEGEQQ